MSDAPAATGRHCENCGKLLTGGWCSGCGQRAVRIQHSVGHFVGEIFEDLTHADSRLWRTSGALLFHPGRLTREFLAGRRARYLPPVRLYLVLSVLFFALTQLLPGSEGAELSFDAGPAGEAHAQTTRHCTAGYDGPGRRLLIPLLEHACLKLRERGAHGLQASFEHNLPRALFVMLPVFALFMKPLYWRPRRLYVEHLLFCLHNHAFAFLLLCLLALLACVLFPPPVMTAARIASLTWFTAYIYRGMRVVYGQSPRRTKLKFGVLALVYAACAVATLAAAGLYSALTL